MNQQRRDALRISTVLSLALAAGLFKASDACAEDWNKAAFGARNLDDTVKALGGTAAPLSNEIFIEVPDIAENGARVPVKVSSMLPNVQQIAILVEKNPSALAANFTIPAGTEGWISTCIKMAQTSNVHALVKADGKWVLATKEVKVTLGGCG
jgi:sulfur-oxidizing protein SoxY